MKSFKSLLVIVALFAIGSVSAKRTAGYTGGATPAKPVVTPTVRPSKPLPAVPVMTTNSANTAIERELTNIDQNLNKIKNFAAGVLQNNKISVTEKAQFMKSVEATYDSIHESITEDLTSLKSIFE
jgi:hypothetical protein